MALSAGGQLARYRYDAAGQRYLKAGGSAGGGGTYSLLGAGGETLGRFTATRRDSSGAVAAGSGALVSWNLALPAGTGGAPAGRIEAGGTRRYYLTGRLGSVRTVVAEGGGVVETRDYYPFGLRMPGRTGASGAPAEEGFTGHERDGQTQLLYAGARYLMPALARWTTTDPLADDFPAWSPYNYSMNNPVNLVDPDGMAPGCPDCDDPLIGVRAIATAFYDVKHSAENLILNSSVVGDYLFPTEEGMKWQAGYATDTWGNEMFATEIRQVPTGGALRETANVALDALVVVSGNSLGGSTAGLLARSGLEGQAARSAAKNLKYTDDALSKTDLYHNYPSSFDSHIISSGTKVSANEGTGYLMRGTINGREGVYNVVKKDGVVTHRDFVSQKQWAQRSKSFGYGIDYDDIQ